MSSLARISSDERKVPVSDHPAERKVIFKLLKNTILN